MILKPENYKHVAVIISNCFERQNLFVHIDSCMMDFKHANITSGIQFVI